MNEKTTEIPAIGLAVAWIASQREGVTIPALKARFGLTAKEACEAIALARKGEIHDGE